MYSLILFVYLKGVVVVVDDVVEVQLRLINSGILFFSILWQLFDLIDTLIDQSLTVS